MFCITCGAKIGAEGNFCRQCGRKLDKSFAPKISEEAFDRALPEQEQVTALLERAYRLRKDNDLAGAIALCREVLGIRPDSTTAHGLLGQLYEQNGERDKAVEQYERVLQLNPGSIADRVKLDDLREGVTKLPVPRSALPKVVVVHPNGAPMRGVFAWGVALAVLLLLSGAALAAFFNRRDGGNVADNGTEARRIARVPKAGAADEQRYVPETSEGAVTTVHPQASSSAGTVPASKGTALNTPATATVYPFSAAPIQYAGPPIQYVIAPPTYAQRQPAAASVTPATGARRPNKAATQAERAPAEGDMGSERVHLPEADGDGHRLVITVGRSDSGGAGSRSTASQGAEPPVISKIREHSGPVDPAAAFVPTAESSSFISVGHEKLNKMDYAGAILAYRKALAGANDETAFIYQKLAETYQARTETKNALTMYERALDEYKKLISAGRQIDRAGNGIRICETGIKICSSE